MIRAVLTILQALSLPGCCAGVLPPETCCHYASGHENECDDRTDDDFFDHGLMPPLVAGPQKFSQSAVCRSCIIGQQEKINHFSDKQLHVPFFWGVVKRQFYRRLNASFSCLIYSISTMS
jgi:hypothetical protein